MLGRKADGIFDHLVDLADALPRIPGVSDYGYFLHSKIGDALQADSGHALVEAIGFAAHRRYDHFRHAIVLRQRQLGRRNKAKRQENPFHRCAPLR